MLPVAESKKLLGVILNTFDLVAAVFLIFGGGMIAALRSPTTGYASIALGVLMLYLSTGVWMGGRWKLVTRFVIYIGALSLILVALVVLVFVRHEALNAQFPLPIVFILLVINEIVSIIHLRRRVASTQNASR